MLLMLSLHCEHLSTVTTVTRKIIFATGCKNCRQPSSFNGTSVKLVGQPQVPLGQFLNPNTKLLRPAVILQQLLTLAQLAGPLCVYRTMRTEHVALRATRAVVEPRT